MALYSDRQVVKLRSGGSEKIENLRKVKMREHIELISQMAGKVGM